MIKDVGEGVLWVVVGGEDRTSKRFFVVDRSFPEYYCELPCSIVTDDMYP